ncbi:DUF5130 family protein [Bailinhaonella thermotolerans]|uniref:DUF5130 family protein n=1 Tax=Bailinhaonella thermotolerans TaxID=1070861 RepID=A0A3A4A6V8_9ACTN|nr:DUF5130 family protein [Bailinhaonella thermotolerans]RJL22757.1 DUF5130 family protein [Bailinhaonella thermotolerans]
MRAITASQAHDIRTAVRDADRLSGLRFAVYLGPARGRARQFAERLHAALGDDRAVLIFVDPDARALEIVTGPRARARLSDGDCRLVAMSMATTFSGGGLVTGLMRGLSALADHARL